MLTKIHYLFKCYSQQLKLILSSHEKLYTKLYVQSPRPTETCWTPQSKVLTYQTPDKMYIIDNSWPRNAASTINIPPSPFTPDTINSICTIRKPNTSNLVQVSCSWRRRNLKPWRLRGCGICQCPVSSRVIDKVHFVVCVNKVCLNVATLTISAIPGPCDCFSLFVVRRI